jgi:hypothetical protein
MSPGRIAQAVMVVTWFEVETVGVGDGDELDEIVVSS